MRTTLDLDDDVIHIARQLAGGQGVSMGRVISDLVRRALEPKGSPKRRNGVPLFVPRKGARKPHLDLVNRIRDEA